MAKLQAHEAAAGNKNAVRLLQRLVDVRHVANAKGNRVRVHAAILYRQTLRVAYHPIDVVDNAHLFSALLAVLHHRRVDVAYDDTALLLAAIGRRRRRRYLARRLERPESNVAR